MTNEIIASALHSNGYYKDGTETISLDAVHQAFGSDLSSDAPPQILHFDAGFFVLYPCFCKLIVKVMQKC